MLTQQQRDTFRLAIASYNRSIDDLDINEVVSTDAEVVETRDTIEDIYSRNGRRLDRNGNRPAVPRELYKTLLGQIYIWQNVQTHKGARRGTLYVMDFGDARATFFDGEV